MIGLMNGEKLSETGLVNCNLEQGGYRIVNLLPRVAFISVELNSQTMFKSERYPY